MDPYLLSNNNGGKHETGDVVGAKKIIGQTRNEVEESVHMIEGTATVKETRNSTDEYDSELSSGSEVCIREDEMSPENYNDEIPECNPFNLLFTSEDENEMNFEYDWEFDSSSSKSSEESPSSPEESPIPKNEECGIYDIKEKEEQYLASCEGFNQDGYNEVKLVSYKKFRFSQEDLNNISSQGFLPEHTSSVTSQYKNKRMAHFLKIHSNALVEAIIAESLNEITKISDQKTDLVKAVENRKLNQINQEQYLTINPREIMEIKTQSLIKNMTFDINNKLKSDFNRTILTTTTADPIETKRINGSNKILDDSFNIDTSDLNRCFLPKINDQESSEGHLEPVLRDYVNEESSQDDLHQTNISREAINLTDESLNDAFSDRDFDRLMSHQLIQDDFLDEEIIVDLKTDKAKEKTNQIELNDESSVQHLYHGYIDNVLNSDSDDTENEVNLGTSETVSSGNNFQTDVSDFQKELTGTVKDINVESRENIFVVTEGGYKEITKLDNKTVAIRSVEEGDVQNIMHDIMECIVANEVCHKIEMNNSVCPNSILFNNSKPSDVDGSPLICENLKTRNEEDKTKKISETNDNSESYDDVTVSDSFLLKEDISHKIRENIKEYDIKLDRKEIETIMINKFQDDMVETNNLLCIGELTNKNETMEAETIDTNNYQDDIGKCVNSEYNEKITHENIATDENWDEEKAVAEIKKTNDYQQDMSKYLNSIWPLQKVTKDKTMETFAVKFGGNQTNPISSEDNIIESYNLIYENVSSQNGKVRKDEEWVGKETMEFTDTNENHNNGTEYVNLASDKYLINKNGNMEEDKENGEAGITGYDVKFIHSEDVIESNFIIHEDISENENSDEQIKVELTEPDGYDDDEDVIKYDMLVSDEEPVYENDEAVENVDSAEDFIPFSNYEQYGAEYITPLQIIKDEDEAISNYAVSLKQIMEMEMTDDGNNYLIADELFLEANDEGNSESLPSDNNLENGKESCDSNVLNEEKCIEISDVKDDPTVLMPTNKKSVLTIPSEDTSSFEFIAQYKSDEIMTEDMILNPKKSEISTRRDHSEEDFLTRSCFLDNDFTFEEIESKNSNSIHVATISSVIEINQLKTPSVNEDVKWVSLRKDAEEQRNLLDSESMIQDNTTENSFYAITNEYLKLDKEFTSGIYLHKKKSHARLDENSDRSDFDEVKPLIEGIIDQIARENNELQIHSENSKIESPNFDQKTNILTDGNLNKSSGANQSGNYELIDMEMIGMNMFQDTNEELFPIDFQSNDGYLTPGYRLSSDKDNEIIEGNDEITSGSSEEIMKWILDDSSKERNEQEIPSVGRTLMKITSVDRFSRLLLQDEVDNSIEIKDEAESLEKSFWDNFDNQNGSVTAILPTSEFTILNSDISKNTDVTQNVSTKVEENDIMSADKETVEKCPKSVRVCRPLKEILAAQINNTNKSTRNLVPEETSSISQETLLRVSESQLESIYNAIGFILNEIENTIKIAQSELDTTETNNNNNNNSPDFNPMWKLDSRTTAENFKCHTNDQTTTMIPLKPCNTSSNSFGNVPFGYEFVAKKDQGSKDCAQERDGTRNHLLEDTLQKINFLETSRLYNDTYKQMITENQNGIINTNYSEDYDAVGNIKDKGYLDFVPLLAESINVKLKKAYGSSDLNKHFLNVIKESSKESEIHSYEESAFRTDENNTKMENALNLGKEFNDLEFSSQEKTGRKEEYPININELEEFVSCEKFDVIQEADHFETENSYEYWKDQVNDTFVEGINLKSTSDRGNEIKESVSLNDGLTVWYSAENLDLTETVGQSACDDHVAPVASTSSSQPSSRKKLKKISSLRKIAQLAIWKSKHHDLALKVQNKNMGEILPDDKVALKSTSKRVTKSSHGDFRTKRRIVSESSLSTAKESNRSSQKRGVALDMSSSLRLVAFENLMMHRQRNMDEGLAQTDNLEFAFDSWRLEAVTHAIYLAAFVMIFAVFDTAVSLYYSLNR